MSQKDLAYLIFYNLKKPEQLFVMFGMQYPGNPSF